MPLGDGLLLLLTDFIIVAATRRTWMTDYNRTYCGGYEMSLSNFYFVNWTRSKYEIKSTFYKLFWKIATAISEKS